MNKLIKLKFNGIEIKDGNFAKALIESNVKEGESISYYPFNYFDDEETEFKADVLEIHAKQLLVEKIIKKYVASWNSSINLIVEISLTNCL